MIKSVCAGNRHGGVGVLLPPFHIVFERHRRRGMPRCRLRLLDVFGRVVEVCQYSCAKAARRNGFIKACVALDALTHTPDLRIGQWAIPAENKAFRSILRQMRDNLGHKVDGAATGLCLRILNQRLIARRMRNRPFNMNGVLNATLRNWAKKLYQTNNAHREKKDALWHTFRDDNGIKRQEPADPDGEDYKAYCAARSSSMKAIEEADEKANASPEIRKMAYGRMITSLYGKLGYYYWCPAIELNGMGEDIDEILRLVKEILSSPE